MYQIYYFCSMDKLQYIRQINRTPEFDEYYNAQPEKVRDKYKYILNIIATQYVISEKFVKKLETSELYEMRISIGSNEHRTLLFAIDNLNIMQCTRVLLLNSFLKEDSKQYKREINTANEILKRYTL